MLLYGPNLKKTVTSSFTSDSYQMKRQLFLHLGTEKTGTTTLQRRLRELRTTLSNHYLYPEPIMTESHMLETCLICREAGCEFPDLSWAPQLQKYLDEVTPPKLNVLVDSWFHELKASQSRNNLRHYPPLVLSCEFAYKAFNKPKSLKYIKSLFSEFDINFVVYLRRIDKHANAALLQSLKRGNWFGLRDFSTLKTRTKERVIRNHLDLPNLLKKISSVFGSQKIILRSFDPACLYKSDVVSDFFHVIGLEPLNYQKTSHKNINITPPYDFLIHFVNKFGNPVKRSQDDNKLLDSILAMNELNDLQIDSSKYAYSPQDRLEMNNIVGKVYDELCSQFSMKPFPNIENELIGSAKWVDLSFLDDHRVLQFDRVISEALLQIR